MPTIQPQDEHKYYDDEELKYLRRGTGLFPPGMRGHGLQPIRPAAAGFGYEITGEGILDSLVSGIENHKDAITGIAQMGSAVANAGKNSLGLVQQIKSYRDATHKAVMPEQDKRIDRKLLEKLRREAELTNSKKSIGGGFRYD